MTTIMHPFLTGKFGTNALWSQWEQQTINFKSVTFCSNFGIKPIVTHLRLVHNMTQGLALRKCVEFWKCCTSFNAVRINIMQNRIWFYLCISCVAFDQSVFRILSQCNWHKARLASYCEPALRYTVLYINYKYSSLYFVL